MRMAIQQLHAFAHDVAEDPSNAFQVQAERLTTCGFCLERLPRVISESPQVPMSVLIGPCGHLFHASTRDGAHLTCYQKVTHLNRDIVSHAHCAHCRRTGATASNEFGLPAPPPLQPVSGSSPAALGFPEPPLPCYSIAGLSSNGPPSAGSSVLKPSQRSDFPSSRPGDFNYRPIVWHNDPVQTSFERRFPHGTQGRNTGRGRVAHNPDLPRAGRGGRGRGESFGRQGNPPLPRRGNPCPRPTSATGRVAFDGEPKASARTGCGSAPFSPKDFEGSESGDDDCRPTKNSRIEEPNDVQKILEEG